MKGWKTWLAAAGFGVMGLTQIVISGDVQGGVQRILEGLMVVGIGHKIEKITPQ